MWRRDQVVGPEQRPGAAGRPANAPSGDAEAEGRHSTAKEVVNIGKSVVIKGDVIGSEDLVIEGDVEGTINLRDHVLTIGPNGRIKAQVFAKSVIVLGEVTGTLTASDMVDIRDNGSVDGDIVAPRVAIAAGARFRGSVDMQLTARRSDLPRSRMLVQVVVPQKDANAYENTVTLQQAVAELLETFDYVPDREVPDLATRADKLHEPRVHPTP